MRAVPSDGWGQLLIYRKDLFDKAGLSAPGSLEDIRRAAQRLNTPGRAGITLAPGRDTFTAQSFEYVALAAGCQLGDDAGEASLDSPACVQAELTLPDGFSEIIVAKGLADPTALAYAEGVERLATNAQWAS